MDVEKDGAQQGFLLQRGRRLPESGKVVEKGRHAFLDVFFAPAESLQLALDPALGLDVLALGDGFYLKLGSDRPQLGFEGATLTAAILAGMVVLQIGQDVRVPVAGDVQPLDVGKDGVFQFLGTDGADGAIRDGGVPSRCG